MGGVLIATPTGAKFKSYDEDGIYILVLERAAASATIVQSGWN